MIQPRRVAFMAAVVTFSLCATCILALYKGGSNLFVSSRATELSAIARSAASTIDAALHRKVAESGAINTADYRRAIEPLARIQAANPQVRYIYTCILRNGKVYFVLDPTPPGDHDKDGIDDKSYVMDEYPEVGAALKGALEKQESRVETEPTTDRWGTFMSAFAPFYGVDGKMEGVVGVDMTQEANLARQSTFRQLLVLALVLTLAFASLTFSFVWRFAAKFRQQQEAILNGQLDLEEANRTLEQRVSERTEELQVALRTKDIFLTNMSHEMRTPLNGIIGMNQLLQDSHLSAGQQEYVHAIGESASHLLELVSDILSAAQLRHSTLAIQIGPVCINHEIARACEPLRASARRGGVSLVLDLDPSLDGTFSSDPLRLRQVVANLVGNAIKFTAKGGAIVVSSSRQGSSWKLEVADTGIGIPSDKLGFIFEEFSQVDSSPTRRHGGTGLGLAITRGIVSLLHGSVEVSSVLGEGSTFIVTLPLIQHDATAAA